MLTQAGVPRLCEPCRMCFSSGSTNPPNAIGGLCGVLVRSAPRSRHGVSLMEAIAATALLSALTAMLVPIIGRTADAREEAAAHATAVAEVANVMERIALLRGDGELTQTELDAIEISGSAARELPQPELTLALAPESGDGAARRLTVALSWRNTAGERSAPVVATSFLYEGTP